MFVVKQSFVSGGQRRRPYRLPRRQEEGSPAHVLHRCVSWSEARVRNRWQRQTPKIQRRRKTPGAPSSSLCITKRLPDSASLSKSDIPVSQLRRLALRLPLVSSRGVLDARPIGDDGNVAPNLFFLKGGGVRQIAGLKVAYLGGHHDSLSYQCAPSAPHRAPSSNRKRRRLPFQLPPSNFSSRLLLSFPSRSDTSAMGAIAAVAAGEYRQVDVASLLRDLTAANGGAPIGPQQQQLLPDLLLTSEWPRGVALNTKAMPTPEARATATQPPPRPPDACCFPPSLPTPLARFLSTTRLQTPQVAACSLGGTGVVAELASEVQPRYHVAGIGGVFFSREPYKCVRPVVPPFSSPFAAPCPPSKRNPPPTERVVSGSPLFSHRHACFQEPEVRARDSVHWAWGGREPAPAEVAPRAGSFPSLAASRFSHSSRFRSLSCNNCPVACVDCCGREVLWFLALPRTTAPVQALTPASSMDPMKLSANTSDTTQSPYLAPPTAKPQGGGGNKSGGGGGRGDGGGADAGQNWRWQMPGGEGGGGGRPAKRPRTTDKPADPECTVFVRNIPYSVDDLALRHFFEAR